MARTFRQTDRFQARTLPEVVEILEREVSRAGRSKGITYGGGRKKITTEMYINTVVLQWLALPEAERDRKLIAGLKLFETMIASDVPVDIERVLAMQMREPEAQPEGDRPAPTTPPKLTAKLVSEWGQGKQAEPAKPPTRRRSG